MTGIVRAQLSNDFPNDLAILRTDAINADDLAMSGAFTSRTRAEILLDVAEKIWANRDQKQETYLRDIGVLMVQAFNRTVLPFSFTNTDLYIRKRVLFRQIGTFHEPSFQKGVFATPPPQGGIELNADEKGRWLCEVLSLKAAGIVD